MPGGMRELAEFSGGVSIAIAIGNCLTERRGNMELDEPTPSRWFLNPRRYSRPGATRVFSGNRPDNFSQPPGRRLVDAWPCSQGRFVFKMRVLKVDRR